MNTAKFETIDEYIKLYPQQVQTILEKIRKIIQKAAPEAVETINYQMPTFKLDGNLVHFAAYEHHIGFYPTPPALTKFEKELKDYKTSKGAVQFQLTEPIPYHLITKIVEYRAKSKTGKEY